jgi:restriction endonuclease S subunit
MLSDKTLQLVPNEQTVDKGFLLQGLRSEPYRGFVERSANGTEAKNITQETLRAAPFWLPSIEVQRRVAEQLESIGKGISAAASNLHNLERLRDSMSNTIFI